MRSNSAFKRKQSMEMVRQEKLKLDFAKKNIKRMSSDKRAQRTI